jgi:GTP-binding protein
MVSMQRQILCAACARESSVGPFTRVRMSVSVSFARIVTMDIRRGLTLLDETLLRWLEPRELPVAVLLTKADKLSRGAGLEQQRKLAALLGSAVKLTRFSALSGDGVGQAQAWLEEWLSPPYP